MREAVSVIAKSTSEQREAALVFIQRWSNYWGRLEALQALGGDFSSQYELFARFCKAPNAQEILAWEAADACWKLTGRIPADIEWLAGRWLRYLGVEFSKKNLQYAVRLLSAGGEVTREKLELTAQLTSAGVGVTLGNLWAAEKLVQAGTEVEEENLELAAQLSLAEVKVTKEHLQQARQLDWARVEVTRRNLQLSAKLSAIGIEATKENLQLAAQLASAGVEITQWSLDLAVKLAREGMPVTHKNLGLATQLIAAAVEITPKMIYALHSAQSKDNKLTPEAIRGLAAHESTPPPPIYDDEPDGTRDPRSIIE